MRHITALTVREMSEGAYPDGFRLQEKVRYLRERIQL